MTNGIDKRALFEALQQDAARLGISVGEMIKRVTSGAHVVGGSGVPVRGAEIPSGPTYMASKGDGAWLDVEDRQTPEDEDSDFSDLVQAREQALVDGGGDTLAQEAIFADRHRAALARDAAFVRNVPKSITTAMLGQQVQVNSDGTTKQVVYWQGATEETLPVTVAISPISTSINAGGLTGLAQPFAKVTFGTMNGVHTFFVDIGTGIQFTVPASSITVDVGLETQTGIRSSSMLIAGAISFHPTVRTSPLTRTVYVDPIPNGDAIIQVPPFARRVIFYRNPATTAITAFNFVDTFSRVVYQTALAASAQFTDPIWLSTDVTSVDIFAADGTGSSHLRAIFELAL
jgi:hypothetical protein